MKGLTLLFQKYDVMDPQIPPQMAVGYQSSALRPKHLIPPESSAFGIFQSERFHLQNPLPQHFMLPARNHQLLKLHTGYRSLDLLLLLPAIRPRQMVLPMELSWGRLSGKWPVHRTMLAKTWGFGHPHTTTIKNCFPQVDSKPRLL